jgi:hypothetical protein
MATVVTNASVAVAAGAAKAVGLSTGPDNTGTASATALAKITLLISSIPFTCPLAAEIETTAAQALRA